MKVSDIQSKGTWWVSLGLIGLSLTSRASKSDNFGFISGSPKLGLLMPAMFSAQPFSPTVSGCSFYFISCICLESWFIFTSTNSLPSWLLSLSQSKKAEEISLILATHIFWFGWSPFPAFLNRRSKCITYKTILQIVIIFLVVYLEGWSNPYHIQSTYFVFFFSSWCWKITHPSVSIKGPTSIICFASGRAFAELGG